jgi:hypothetical protein
VGSINQQNGEIVTRHYEDTGNSNPKAEALRIYHEMEKGLTRPAEVEEHTDNDARVADAFRRAIANAPYKA